MDESSAWSGCLWLVDAKSYVYFVILHLLMGKGVGYFSCIPGEAKFTLRVGCCSSAWRMHAIYIPSINYFLFYPRWEEMFLIGYSLFSSRGEDKHMYALAGGFVC